MARVKTHPGAPPRASWLSKQALLPLPNECLREMSLAGHLALVGCGPNLGSQHSLNALIRATYLSFLLWWDGCGEAELSLFVEAESVLDAAEVRAQDDALWRLDDAESVLLQRVLKLHDDQLGGVSTRVFLQAQARLSALLRRIKLESPIKRACVKTR